jgi:hypothetical protein
MLSPDPDPSRPLQPVGWGGRHNWTLNYVLSTSATIARLVTRSTPRMTAPVLDLVTFKAAKGTPEADIRRAAETTGAFLRGCPGFLSANCPTTPRPTPGPTSSPGPTGPPPSARRPPPGHSRGPRPDPPRRALHVDRAPPRSGDDRLIEEEGGETTRFSPRPTGNPRPGEPGISPFRPRSPGPYPVSHTGISRITTGDNPMHRRAFLGGSLAAAGLLATASAALPARAANARSSSWRF